MDPNTNMHLLTHSFIVDNELEQLIKEIEEHPLISFVGLVIVVIVITLLL